jgi:hypothetical protein
VRARGSPMRAGPRGGGVMEVEEGGVWCDASERAARYQ